MKPLHVGILVLVGALGGALIMKVMQRPKELPARNVTLAAAPAPAPAPAPILPVAEPVSPPAQPAAAPRPKPVQDTPQVPVALAQNQPPATPEPVSTPPAPEPVPEPVQSAPPPPAAPEPQQAPEPPAPHSVTLPAGLVLTVRLGESLSSQHNQAGDTFTATLDAPVVADGFVIAERGARTEGRVVEAQKSGLVIELTRLNTSDGQHVEIQTESYRKQSPKISSDDVGTVAAVAGIGAVIGAIAGGGKGAAIGAGAGGAAGAGGVAVSRNKSTNLPTETKLTFRLKQPVTLTERLNR